MDDTNQELEGRPEPIYDRVRWPACRLPV